MECNDNYEEKCSPFHEVGTVLVLDSKHLFVHLLRFMPINPPNWARLAFQKPHLHGHPSSEHSRHGEITSVSEVQRGVKNKNLVQNPHLGSHAAIMFLASNICWVSSGTVRALLIRLFGKA